MTIFEYIKYYPELKPVVNKAFTAGVKFGLWTGGIIIFLILSILHVLFNFHF